MARSTTAAALLLLCCAAAGLLPARAADGDAAGAVEAAAARGEALALAAPSNGEVGPQFFAPSPPKEPLASEALSFLRVGAVLRASDLKPGAANFIGGGGGAAPLLAQALTYYGYAATYAGNLGAKGKVDTYAYRQANTPFFAETDANARLLGVPRDSPLKPGPVVTFVGTLENAAGFADVDPAYGVPPTQPVRFKADETVCFYAVSVVDDKFESVCEVAFPGRATADVAFDSALPPPADFPLLTGGALAYTSAVPLRTVARVSCELNRTAPVSIDGDCKPYFPRRPAPAAGKAGDSGANAAVLQKLRDAAAAARAPSSPDAAKEQARQGLAALPAKLREALGPVIAGGAAAPSFFFGGGGGGGFNITSSLDANLGVTVDLAALKAYLADPATASPPAQKGYPLALVSSSFNAIKAENFVKAASTVAANFFGLDTTDGRYTLKAKLFGVSPLNPLAPGKTVAYAGGVSPVTGTFYAVGGEAPTTLPASFSAGQECNYLVLGVDAIGNSCLVAYGGVTKSAPTFPTLLPKGTPELPLVATAYTNFALRPASLIGFACELTTPDKPFLNTC